MINHFLRKSCHHMPTFIFQYEGVHYLAADEVGSREFEGELILNLTGHPGPKLASTTYKIPELAKHMATVPDEIVLAWEDFGSPPVKNSFWLALHKYAKKKKYEYICFRCLHGHGRTGTGLAAMKIALQGCNTESSIQDIREIYCGDAVESDSQVIYLLQLDYELNKREMLDETEIRELLNKMNPKPINKFGPKTFIKKIDILEDNEDGLDWHSLFNNETNDD